MKLTLFTRLCGKYSGVLKDASNVALPLRKRPAFGLKTLQERSQSVFMTAP